MYVIKYRPFLDFYLKEFFKNSFYFRKFYIIIIGAEKIMNRNCKI